MYWDKLKNDVVIIDYKVDNSGDAYKLFEITNNRGLELTKTDIIKNFILGHIAIIVENSDGDEKRLKKILEKWQEIIVNLDGIKKDDFFRHFLMGRTCSKIPFSRIITKFKDYYFLNVEDVELLTEFKRYNDIYETPESTHRKRIEKFLDDLINSSKIYRQIVIDGFGNNTLTKELTNLKKIEATPTYSFLLAFITKMDMDKEVELKKVVKVIKVLQTFMIRRHICKERTGELDDIFSNLCDVDCNDTDQLVLNVKQRLQKYYPDDNKFVEEFPNHDYKGKVNRAKYVLEQIEYRIKPPNEKMIVWEEVELEHIIPQKIKPKNSKKFGDWEKYLGEKDTEKHPEYLNKIGNLTLLTKELNLKASNNPFFTKRDEYVGSDIELTKNLCNYRFFKIKNIKERSNWLAQKSLEIWKF